MLYSPFDIFRDRLGTVGWAGIASYPATPIARKWRRVSSPFIAALMSESEGDQNFPGKLVERCLQVRETLLLPPSLRNSSVIYPVPCAVAAGVFSILIGAREVNGASTQI
jgi:hypothetical protein